MRKFDSVCLACLLYQKISLLFVDDNSIGFMPLLYAGSVH